MCVSTESEGLLCAPYEGLGKVEHVPGSTIVTANCGHAVWLSPQGQAFLSNRPDAVTVCTDCTHPRQWFNRPAVPGAVQAVIQHSSDPESVRRLVKLLGIQET